MYSVPWVRAPSAGTHLAKNAASAPSTPKPTPRPQHSRITSGVVSPPPAPRTPQPHVVCENENLCTLKDGWSILLFAAVAVQNGTKSIHALSGNDGAGNEQSAAGDRSPAGYASATDCAAAHPHRVPCSDEGTRVCLRTRTRVACFPCIQRTRSYVRSLRMFACTSCSLSTGNDCIPVYN